MTKIGIGRRVYKIYRPSIAGVVREVTSRGAFENQIKVAWIDGSTSVESEFDLKDFDALIADHEKKLATHRATLEKIKSLGRFIVEFDAGSSFGGWNRSINAPDVYELQEDAILKMKELEERYPNHGYQVTQIC